MKLLAERMGTFLGHLIHIITFPSRMATPFNTSCMLEKQFGAIENLKLSPTPQVSVEILSIK